MNQCIIIGAPRSGTNMLRDVLTGLPRFATWPCDEINLVWRHGNRSAGSDELTADKARPEVRTYLHREFDRIARKYDATTVVEKTCANSLRVEFVARAFPDAKYLFVRRDGIDAAASAMSRWDAPLDVRYTVAKTRFVPPRDVPYYGLQFLKTRLIAHKRAGKPQPARVEGWWGPKPNDFEQLRANHPLDEICLLQWQLCVESALRGLATLPDEQVHEISYEDFVRSPEDQLRSILAFLGHEGAFSPDAVAGVSAGSVGKGRAALGEPATARLESLAEVTLRKLGYV